MELKELLSKKVERAEGKNGTDKDVEAEPHAAVEPENNKSGSGQVWLNRKQGCGKKREQGYGGKAMKAACSS